MKTLDLNDLKSSNLDDFKIIYKNNRYVLKYRNDNFIIDSESIFNDCNIHISKIKMNFTHNHNDFLLVVNHLYDIISKLIKNDDNIFGSKIINPIYSSNNHIKMLISMINSKTIIRNIEND